MGFFDFLPGILGLPPLPGMGGGPPDPLGLLGGGSGSVDPAAAAGLGAAAGGAAANDKNKQQGGIPDIVDTTKNYTGAPDSQFNLFRKQQMGMGGQS